LIHGVAFLCGISTPSLSAQGEQRRLAYFNIDRDNALKNPMGRQHHHASPAAGRSLTPSQ
jgi:hypothetical protein